MTKERLPHTAALIKCPICEREYCPQCDSGCPALLEALKAMVHFYIDEHNFHCDRGCESPAEQARAAIALGEGETA